MGKGVAERGALFCLGKLSVWIAGLKEEWIEGTGFALPGGGGCDTGGDG